MHRVFWWIDFSIMLQFRCKDRYTRNIMWTVRNPTQAHTVRKTTSIFKKKRWKYTPKQSNSPSSEDFRKFLSEADDEKYLITGMKEAVCLVLNQNNIRRWLLWDCLGLAGGKNCAGWQFMKSKMKILPNWSSCTIRKKRLQDHSLSLGYFMMFTKNIAISAPLLVKHGHFVELYERQMYQTGGGN